MFFVEPLPHGDAIEIVASTMLPAHRQDGSAHGEFFREVQEMELKKRLGEMRGCGEKAGTKHTPTAAGLHEYKFAVKGDVTGDAQPSVKIEKIDAAAEQDVLAIVDGLAARARRAHFVRGRAPAEKRPSFEEPYLVTRAAKRSRSRESGQASADDDYIGHEGIAASLRLLLVNAGTPAAARIVIIDDQDDEPDYNRKEQDVARV